jgi:hypothetical protein
LPPSDPHFIVGEIRDLNQAIRAGGPSAIAAFHRLVNRVLTLTVLAEGQTVKLFPSPSDRSKATLRGRQAREPLKLNDGRYLRLAAHVYLDPSGRDNFLRVEETSYQYQLDTDGDRWVFRYDYLRNPSHAYPAAHVQIRGALAEHKTFPTHSLPRLHWPTGRVSLEAVIRLLAEQFHVPCNQPPEVWRPALAESERDFLQVAHRPLSGPEL